MKWDRPPNDAQATRGGRLMMGGGSFSSSVMASVRRSAHHHLSLASSNSARLTAACAAGGQKRRFIADLCVAFGGRIAEELIFGYDKVTTGAQSDIEMATRMARPW